MCCELGAMEGLSRLVAQGWLEEPETTNERVAVCWLESWCNGCGNESEIKIEVRKILETESSVLQASHI
jgi:hypothetical protein